MGCRAVSQSLARSRDSSARSAALKSHHETTTTGAGFFYRNLEALSARFRVYVVDWRGTGLSSRPKFRPREREAAESFFLDGLEARRCSRSCSLPMSLSSPRK